MIGETLGNLTWQHCTELGLYHLSYGCSHTVMVGQRLNPCRLHVELSWNKILYPKLFLILQGVNVNKSLVGQVAPCRCCPHCINASSVKMNRCSINTVQSNSQGLGEFALTVVIMSNCQRRVKEPEMMHILI